VPQRRHDASFVPEDGRRIDVENARQGDPAQPQPEATRFQIVVADRMKDSGDYFVCL
jgi:hypothetical protein